MKAVNAGQIDGGVIYHYYRFVDQAKRVRTAKHQTVLRFKHQDPGAFVSISGGGVLASSKHKKSRAGPSSNGSPASRAGAAENQCAFEYAVGVDAASNPKLTPLKAGCTKVEPSSLNSKVIELMTQAGLL